MSLSIFRTRPLLTDPTSCGYLDRIPLELIFKIFEYLSLAEVGTMALTSESMRLRVVSWVASTYCQVRVLEPPSSFPLVFESSTKDSVTSKEMIWQSVQDRKLSSFAILCKRVTSLYSTKDRIVFAIKYFDEALTRQNELARRKKKSEQSTDWTSSCYVIKFFCLFHTFVRGWDESEFPSILHYLNKKFGIATKIREFLESTSRREVSLDSEMRLRLISRCLVWDLAGRDYGNRATWILTILKFLVGNDSKFQALFFLLIFGLPCEDIENHLVQTELLNPHQLSVLSELNNHTDWDAYSESTAEDYSEGKEMFFTLAQAVCSCMNSNPRWRDEVLNLFLEDLFVTPKPWPNGNIAGFLLFCSEQLIVFYMTAMLDSNDPQKLELAVSRMVNMLVTSYKYDNVLCSHRGIGKVFDTICCHPVGQTRQKYFRGLVTSIVIDLVDENLDTFEIDEIITSFAMHIVLKVEL